MEDLIQELNQTPATEGNLQRIKDLVSQALSILNARTAAAEGVPPISDEPHPIAETKEIPAATLSGHKKGTKKKSGD